jgi:excisionase family DNA binding protein
MSKQSLPSWVPPRLLTVAEAAEIIHISARQLRRMINQGTVSVIYFGRAVRIRPETIAELLEGTGKSP